MSNISDALEVEVAAIGAIWARMAGRPPAPRARAEIDRHFTNLLKLIAPRIRHFIRAYGLISSHDDGEQACAIALLRAVEIYNPTKARFTTLLNWQLRGELQALRFRLHQDARGPARKAGAQTVSLDALIEAAADANSGIWQFEDEGAVERAEALASALLARRACGTLLDDHYTRQHTSALRKLASHSSDHGVKCVKPGTLDPAEIEQLETRLQRERAIVAAHLLSEAEADDTHGLTSEQCRQITRRTLRALSDHAQGNPVYDPDASPSQRRH